MSSSCHLDRALNDQFSVECLFWFFQPTQKSDLKVLQITKNWAAVKKDSNNKYLTFNTNFDILRSVQMTWTRHKSMGTQWQTLHIRFLYSSQLTLSPTLYIIYICIVWYCYGALLRTSPMNTYVKVSFRLWSFKFGGLKLVGSLRKKASGFKIYSFMFWADFSKNFITVNCCF